jgi:hypothetical protein
VLGTATTSDEPHAAIVFVYLFTRNASMMGRKP